MFYKYYFKIFRKSCTLILFYFFILGIFLNIVFFLINEKNFSKFTRNIVFNDILNVTYWEYNDKLSKVEDLIVGDSIAFGIGDEFWSGVQNFSISKKINKDIINISKSGSGSITNIIRVLETKKVLDSSLFLKDLGDIKKIFYFVYEGNDFNDDIEYLKNYNLETAEIQKHIKKKTNNYLEIYFKAFFWGYDYFYSFLIDARFHSAIKKFLNINENKIWQREIVALNDSKENCRSNKVKNSYYEVCYNSQETSGYNLSKKEKNLSLNALEESLKLLKKEFNDSIIYIIYVPSPITINDNLYVNEVLGWDPYINKEFVVDMKKNSSYSEYFEDKIQKFSKKNNFHYISMKKELIELSKNKNVNGQIDTNHLSKYSNNLIAEKIKNYLN